MQHLTVLCIFWSLVRGIRFMGLSGSVQSVLDASGQSGGDEGHEGPLARVHLSHRLHACLCSPSRGFLSGSGSIIGVIMRDTRSLDFCSLDFFSTANFFCVREAEG